MTGAAAPGEADGVARRFGPDYEVDPHAVAEAILARLVAGRALSPEGAGEDDASWWPVSEH